MKKIASRQNAWFQRVRDASREHGAEIVIEGPKAVADAIAAGWKPIAVIASDVDRAESPTHVFSPELFRAISDTKTSQGVIGLFERPRATAEDVFRRRDSIAVALDGVQDPGNVGTIVRLAAAFDAAGVIILPGSADPFGPKAIRASAGAILGVPVVSMTIDEMHRATMQYRFSVIAAEGEAAAEDPPAKHAVLVFGHEGEGVSAEILNFAKSISIETSGRVESLNVAAAAAILLWRSFSQR
jgi:TrmH family RNA methyltransferase